MPRRRIRKHSKGRRTVKKRRPNTSRWKLYDAFDSEYIARGKALELGRVIEYVRVKKVYDFEADDWLWGIYFRGRGSEHMPSMRM